MKAEGRAHTTEPSIKKRLNSVAAGVGESFWTVWYARLMLNAAEALPAITGQKSPQIAMTAVDFVRGPTAWRELEPAQTALQRLHRMQKGQIVAQKESMANALMSLALNGRFAEIRAAILQMQEACNQNSRLV